MSNTDIYLIFREFIPMRSKDGRLDVHTGIQNIIYIGDTENCTPSDVMEHVVDCLTQPDRWILDEGDCGFGGGECLDETYEIPIIWRFDIVTAEAFLPGNMESTEACDCFPQTENERELNDLLDEIDEIAGRYGAYFFYDDIDGFYLIKEGQCLLSFHSEFGKDAFLSSCRDAIQDKKSYEQDMFIVSQDNELIEKINEFITTIGGYQQEGVDQKDL